MVVHVDNLTNRNTRETCDSFTRALTRNVPTNIVGRFKSYAIYAFTRAWLGGRCSNCHQKGFTRQLCRKFRRSSASGILDHPSIKLGPRESDEVGNDWPQKNAFGRLLWLFTIIWPDVIKKNCAITYRTHSPFNRHWQAVLNTIAHLNRTKELEFTFGRGPGLKLPAYVHADFSRKTNNERSVSRVTRILGKIVSLGRVAHRGVWRHPPLKPNKYPE